MEIEHEAKARVERGEGARDIREQKAEGASSNPPQPGEAVAEQSYPDNKPQDLTLSAALPGAGTPQHDEANPPAEEQVPSCWRRPEHHWYALGMALQLL
ncbi:hypothetical protein EK904_003402 [Melospiza melodia maxima]|nr:hypothetical protein EK904_003402 [Melospiza melodia maxima]